MPSIPLSILDPTQPSAGVQTCPPFATGGITPSSQQMRFVYFQARRNEPIARVRIAVGSPGAAATPSLIRFGVYSEAANGDLTLAASTPTDTTLLAAAVTEYSKAFSVALSLVAGAWYAFAPLVVSATTMPQIAGHSGAAAALAGTGGRHRLGAVLASQADLPATVTAGSLGISGQLPYAVLTP